MAQSWKNRRAKMLFTLQSTLHLCNTKSNLTANGENTRKTGALTGELHGNAKVNGRILREQGQLKEALQILNFMDHPGTSVAFSTYASLLQACVVIRALPEGKLVHAHIIQNGFKCRKIFLGNRLVTMYAKCGSLEDGRRVLDQMLDRNVVSWTTMIAAYARHGSCDEALTLFYNMQRTGVQPNQFTFASVLPACMRPNSDTFASVLPACANLAALAIGKELHEVIIRTGFQSDVFVGNALVDMYAKCGSIGDAHRIFDKMPKRTVVSWTAMIVGYAMHGCGPEALQVFNQMQRSGPNPDHITFVGVLSACCHAGLVDDGWQYFDCMTRYYHITPVMEHYCCMVDLLGRAGRLDEAQDFINKMPMKPDAAVWGSLLAACRIHSNIELAERVAEHIFELDPQHASPYVLLSNIYAAAGRWDAIQKVQKMMKDRNVKRRPGCSWIEVNKQVYCFIAGGKSHPQTEEIYAKLDVLSAQIKEAGLLIALGLINTSPGHLTRMFCFLWGLLSMLSQKTVSEGLCNIELMSISPVLSKWAVSGQSEEDVISGVRKFMGESEQVAGDVGKLRYPAECVQGRGELQCFRKDQKANPKKEEGVRAVRPGWTMLSLNTQGSPRTMVQWSEGSQKWPLRISSKMKLPVSTISPDSRPYWAGSSRNGAGARRRSREIVNSMILVSISKKGDVTLHDNYWRITLILVLLKVLTIIINRIDLELEERNFYSKSQTGFRKNEECIGQVIVVKEIILNRTKWCMATYIVFINFKKAYDIVPHEVLRMKLQAAGISRKALKIDKGKVLITFKDEDDLKVQGLIREENRTVVCDSYKALAHPCLLFSTEVIGMHDQSKQQPSQKVVVEGLKWILGKSARSTFIGASVLHLELNVYPICAYNAGQKLRGFFNYNDIKTWITDLVNWPKLYMSRG
eukprot:Gb_18978 [translate_table: standard]